MSYQKITLKEGIYFHKIQTNKFKTNLFAIFLTIPLTRENVTKNALLAAVLRRGTNKMLTQEDISKQLEEMYGAAFDCGIDKIGDNQSLKFYLEVVNNQFLPEKEDLVQKSLTLLTDIVFHPLVEKEQFKEEYVQGEKENLKQIIEGKVDNKATYALESCIESMYKEKPYGLYKYGYIEDLKDITAQNLYAYYQELIQNCQIDIFASGDFGEEKLEQIVEKAFATYTERKPNLALEEETKEEIKEPRKKMESKQISQGKLVIGLDVKTDKEEENYKTVVYNTILGGGSNSKLFQNVREKASLAYTASSSYARRKQNIFIRAGIEIENYDKAVEIIEKQLQDMKEGNFSEEDLSNAKNLLLSTIENIPEEQDTEITYYFGQELAGTEDTIEMYQEKIKNVTKEDVIDVANKIQINTIYFLTNQGGKE